MSASTLLARPPRLEPPTALVIRLSTGVGEGPTPLAAFDAALGAAGVGEYNLIRLSSVIPQGGKVRLVEGRAQLRGRWGDRLYCVYASQGAEVPGEQACAGIGWVLCEDGSGAGLFVEHEGTSRLGIESDIRASLQAMADRRGTGFTSPQMVTESATCLDQPVCAVVVAAYETAGWARA